MTHRTSRIEVLENRIAPAVFFVSADSSGEGALKVFKGSEVAGGTGVELEALNLTGADVAVLLKKGDTLVFDADGDRTVSEGDTTMLKVTSGSAMVFLSDTAEGATVGGFDLNEITGLFVSNKFKGTVSVDVNGSVITAIDAAGKVEAEGGVVTLQQASISQLTVEGQIAQSVLAGGSISNLTVGKPIVVPLGTDRSVGGSIATGSAANDVSVSFNGGATFLTTSFEQQAGKAGPDISNVTLATGAGAIFAGDGGQAVKGKAGKGGSVKNVTVEEGTSVLTIEAGRGGSAEKGKAGAGGGISNVEYTAADGANDAGLELLGGGGGDALTSGGGSGGSISKVKFFQASGDASIRIEGGFAGLGTSGVGGSGGAVSSITIEADRVYGLNIFGGDSVAQELAASGAEREVALPPIFNLKKGGAGGAVSKISFTGQSSSVFFIEGGVGGTGITGGVGGAVSGLELSLSGTGSVAVAGGMGGSSLGGKSGNGGALSKVTLVTDGTFEAVTVTSGRAGMIVQGSSTKLKAGSGGKLSGIEVINDGAIESLDIVSGEGGYVILGAGSSGKSGDVSKVTILNSAVLTSARVHSGLGGTTILLAVGNGGDSGDVSKVKIEDASNEPNAYAIYAGFPSEEYSGPGKGDIFGGSGKLGLSMGGQGVGAKAGSVGDVSGVTLDAPRASVDVGVGGKAGSVGIAAEGDDIEIPPTMPFIGVSGTAGNGGDISGVSGKVGTLRISATGGGDSFGGVGGKGGSVRNVNITEVTDFVHIIAAGDGGFGARGGDGGSLDRITVNGDIGNFTKEFGFTTASASMGGLAAGKAGMPDAKAGSVTKITADRIAAIIAGKPQTGELTYQNAVLRISGIKADVIGADIAGNGFTFIEGGTNIGFQPDADGNDLDGDIAIDGLVLVLAGSKSGLPMNALKLVEVPKVVPMIL